MADDKSEENSDLGVFVSDILLEFLDECEDRLTEIDFALGSLNHKKTLDDVEVLEIKRHVHSLKGMASTFGYSSISLLAHALEDYFETMFAPDETGIHDTQLYVDRMREISEQKENISDSAVAQILRDLPLKATRRTIRKEDHALSILILMPKGLQRRIVASELSQFGFQVLIAQNSLDAIEQGIRLRPDLFMANMVSEDISGLELAGVFNAIKATEKRPFLLVTTTDIEQATLDTFPANIYLLRVGPTFAQDLMTFFAKQGYVAS